MPTHINEIIVQISHIKELIIDGILSINRFYLLNEYDDLYLSDMDNYFLYELDFLLN